MRRVKVFYWQALAEVAALRAFAVSLIPGPFGQRARRRYFAKRLKACGAAFVTEERVHIQAPERVTVGDHVRIGRGCYFSAAGGLDLGAGCAVGAGTKIWTINHNFDDVDTPFIDQGWEFKPVSIGQGAWIGPRCFLKPGTIVHEGAVVWPGTVLAKAVPPFAIVQGNPGRIIGWRKKPIAPGAVDRR